MGNVMDKSSLPAVSEAIKVGVIGLGLMGRSIIACLLASGHRVVGITDNRAKDADADEHVLGYLREMQKEGLLREVPEQAHGRLEITNDFAQLAECGAVIETITENVTAKKQVLRRVEEAVSPDTLIGSNTSGIPISTLQEGALHPERILGIHWAEPAHVTRFMEIVCGDRTTSGFAERAVSFARLWNKEPTLVRRDIRGFITNRIMYAMLREAFFLVENGYATPTDIDRSLRNDYGYWITFAGPFRFMDLTGIPAYAEVMRDLFPELSCSREMPKLMQQVVESGARGVSNAKGFYQYTPEQAQNWEKLFLQFSYDIRALAQKYPEDIGDRV